MSLSPRPDRLTRISRVRARARGRPQGAGQGVRGLDGRDDALGPAEQPEGVHGLGVGDRPVARPGRCPAARRARARRPGSPGRPRSSASLASARPRPAAGRCARRAGRRPTRRSGWRRAAASRRRRRPPRSRRAARRRRGRRRGRCRWRWSRRRRRPATASGSRPGSSRHCARASTPMTRRKSRTIAGNGCGPADRADAVVGVLDVGDPVAERLVHGVLERAAAGGTATTSAPSMPHPGHVEGLPLGVLLAHVDHALQAEQRGRGGGGDAVLAGAGLGDDPGLAHPLGQQRLAEHVVDLVRAGVVEVLALEEAPGRRPPRREPRHLGEQRRPAGVVAQQPGQLGAGSPGRPGASRYASVSSSRAAISASGTNRRRTVPKWPVASGTACSGRPGGPGGVEGWLRPWSSAGPPAGRVVRPAATRSATAAGGSLPVTRLSPTSTASAPAAA